MKPQAWLTFLTVLVPALALSGCEKEDASSSGDVTILAAASTFNAVQEIAVQFRHEHGIDVQVSSGPSNGLARQIQAGAPADIFVSASPDWADAVADDGLEDDRRSLLSNSLVLVVPPGNPAGVTDPPDLVGPRVSHVALAGTSVPAGVYAEVALRDAGCFEQLEHAGRIVRGHDVRHTLNYVARGEVDAGVVYATDARIAPHVVAVYEFPAEVSEEIGYPFVLLKSAADREPARRFWEYLQTEAALEVFRRHGFRVLDETGPAVSGALTGDRKASADEIELSASPIAP
ncbi:Molybdate-binding periplasmic protein precursor [Maioricimonas rarisocia]|uniref:Molybdate-binding periplasmic protein n=1 Tax=Maioricimonas rarisocia TaxID=2528026 RepID=A0A517ZDR4_9PLAN|nr:molybdate ABC transporter substrate-binding protein [Maioricimonas rarisocia]QDU40608.1 Molybdate-binding periplasmic protein precursor [Maioricimonas rarisocia]